MVAMALVIFIMLLMTQAFVAGIEAFRQLKSLGDMDENLRTAGTLMKNDIGGFHFEGIRRISDSNFWIQGPPAQGYVHLAQNTGLPVATPPAAPLPPYFGEGFDGDGLESFYATDHSIACTVKYANDNNPQSFFVANISAETNVYANPWYAINPSAAIGQYQIPNPSVGANPTFLNYTSQWAEVVYFLKPQPAPPPAQDMTQGDAAVGVSPMPLFTLCRRQRLAVTPVIGGASASSVPTSVYSTLQGSAYAEISWVADGTASPPVMHFNTPTDLTVPSNRFNGSVYPYPTLPEQAGWGTATQGNDVILSDVVSFHFQVFYAGATDFSDLVPVIPGNPGVPGVFDTWSNGSGFNAKSLAGSAPIQRCILAIKITLRVWDKRTSNTRQMSFVIQP
jgi:hypothetical protein